MTNLKNMKGLITLFLILVSKLIFVSCIKTIRGQGGPVIKIKNWASSGDYGHWNTNTTDLVLYSHNETYIEVPSNIIGLTLECNATYPVEWKFHRDQWDIYANWLVTITNKVTAKGLDVQSYSTQLRVIGSKPDITGKYTCQQVGIPDISSGMYIFWEGSSPPYLVYAQETITIYREEGDKSEMEFPCHVSKSDIGVELWKEINETDHEVIPMNSSIRWDPMVGFVLKKLPDPYGTWKCIAEDDEDLDFVTIHVEKGQNPKKKEFIEKLDSGASVYFDSSRAQFKCCSNSRKAPKMMHYYCLSPAICSLRKHTLHKIESEKSIGKQIKGNCASYQLYSLQAGVFRCRGDGIDVVREYFFPNIDPKVIRLLRRKKALKTKIPGFKPYYKWSDAEPEKLISVYSYTVKSGTAFYIASNALFHCKASNFYFANGVQWSVTFKNGTVKFLEGRKRRHTRFRLIGNNHGDLQFKIEPDVEKVTCHAAVWNTTDWFDNSLEIKTKEPKEPSIVEPSEQLLWYLNATNEILSCTAHGDPKPFVFWRKDGKVIKGTNVNGTSVYKISRVTYSTQGEYVCEARNFLGNDTVTFRIYVAETGNGMIPTLITVFSVLSVILIVGLICFIKLWKDQRLKMRKLATMAFKDVSNGGNDQTGGQGRGNDKVEVDGSLNINNYPEESQEGYRSF